MSRADDLRARHEAELAVVGLEDELLDLKAQDQPDPDEMRRVKLALRDARQHHRELRGAAPAGAGDATASPDPVRASAKVTRSGGGR